MDYNTRASLAAHVRDTLGIRVRIMPVEVMQNRLLRYDRHRHEIWLSEALGRPQRQFCLLTQIALLSQQVTLDKICQDQAIKVRRRNHC